MGGFPNVRVGPMVLNAGVLGWDSFRDEKTHEYQLYRAYVGISPRDTLVGVHLCLSPESGIGELKVVYKNSW